ncbi:hypothetical protein EXM22_04085 [Oceanispirochaeta crateris]|uniref:Uncharacterized protein n=1 Tax=Oceanispirochaeta crateris TaxID=2518645 RepID=A0A5C1QI61_9SPIO|nr:hypothetical protein [Oceanispirochaeta crateris]QEN07207.1 hypothetical protein EXM22_04085 [Oceanispirochaeta crateris]
MKFLGMDEIIKKDTLIYYRNEYSGSASFALVADKRTSIRFQSIVEMKPTGERDVFLKLLDNIDYPVIPIIKSLKEEIINIDREGLPL